MKNGLSDYCSVTLFFVGMAKAFTRTSAYTLFLSEFEIKLLPLVYVGSAFAGTLVTLVYLRLHRRLSLSSLLSANLCFTAVSLSGFAFALLMTDAKWIVFGLPILSEVIISLTNTESATLNSDVLTLRQGKRLLGLVGSGEFLAEIGVGFSIVVEPTLLGLLNHSHPVVRREVLRKLRRLDSTTAMRLVRDYVETEASPEVLGEAIRTLAYIGETDSVEEIAPYLDHPNAQVKLGAMVGLLKNGGIEGVLVAGSSLLDLSKSMDPNDRTFAAQVCGEIEIASFYRPSYP